MYQGQSTEQDQQKSIPSQTFILVGGKRWKISNINEYFVGWWKMYGENKAGKRNQSKTRGTAILNRVIKEALNEQTFQQKRKGVKDTAMQLSEARAFQEERIVGAKILR